MRIRVSPLLAAAAVIVFSCPVWAHSESTSLRLSRPATIGTMTLKPGKYRLTANSTETLVPVNRRGSIVAPVPGKEVTLKNKSVYTAVVFNGRRIHELQFEGKTQAIKVE